jgi:hypothetical protein
VTVLAPASLLRNDWAAPQASLLSGVPSLMHLLQQPSQAPARRLVAAISASLTVLCKDWWRSRCRANCDGVGTVRHAMKVR